MSDSSGTVADELDWKTVYQFHRSLSGIATKGGDVFSLLCNQNKAGEYADEVFPDRLLYRVTSQTQQRLVEGLRRAVGSGKPVRVFEKVGVNRWKDLSHWVIVQVEPESDGWLFLLNRPAERPEA
jgi:hypothetical protein